MAERKRPVASSEGTRRVKKYGSSGGDARVAEGYRHPESESLMRPDVGTQAQFKKKKKPRTYRYDSSLSPALAWDGQNPAREQGEALIRQTLEAGSLQEAKDAAEKLKALSKPFLDWAGKAERLSFDVPTLPLFVHERLSTKAILETLKGHKRDKQMGLFELFADPQHSITDQVRIRHKERFPKSPDTKARGGQDRPRKSIFGPAAMCERLITVT